MKVRFLSTIVHTYLSRSGNEEKLMALLTPLNVNCHASDGRKVIQIQLHQITTKSYETIVIMCRVLLLSVF